MLKLPICIVIDSLDNHWRRLFPLLIVLFLVWVMFAGDFVVCMLTGVPRHFYCRRGITFSYFSVLR